MRRSGVVDDDADLVGQLPFHLVHHVHSDPLARFVLAQAPVYAQVVDELRNGKKTSHWMWFVFPQLKGLGTSANAEFYGLGSVDEALAYWEHPLLGPRLRECIELVLAASSRTARDIFGTPDDLKLRSCLTLFGHVAPQERIFQLALLHLFGGDRDSRTFELLGCGD
jgi:uncharacterized protein (DUF1810 family)